MFAAIANTFSNCFKIPELKSRILFTFGIMAICRLEALVRIPGLNGKGLAMFLSQKHAGDSGFMGLFNTFTGGGLENCAIAALGIMPYISATIIIQLLTAVVPTLSKLAREEGGRTKLIQYGRYLTVLLCLGQGFFMALGWEHPASNPLMSGWDATKLGPLVFSPGWMFLFQTSIVLTTGTLLLMWLGEQITDRGIGNGVSLIITIGILARLPAAFQAAIVSFFPGGNQKAQLDLFANGIPMILLLAAVIAGVIAITQAQRKIPVQYAQRAVGRKVYAGGTSFMPLRVNYSGVMPIIFAQAILMLPGMVFQHGANLVDSKSPFYHWIGGACQTLGRALQYGSPVYLTVYGLMILFFSYFWVATQFNELQIADDLKKNGGYIPGVRPGQATSDYLHNAMSRITLAGAIFLTVIAVIPILLGTLMGIPQAISQFFGGTSMLIVVGVLLDTMRQMETHLLMRHYDGFLKKGRLRGRF